MLSKFSIFTAGLFLLFLSPLTAFAQAQPLDPDMCVDALGINCSTAGNPGAELAARAMNIIIPLFDFAWLFATTALIYGAAKYIMSTGDEAEAKKAKQVIIYAVLGLIIMVIAGTAINLFIRIPVGSGDIFLRGFGPFMILRGMARMLQFSQLPPL